MDKLIHIRVGKKIKDGMSSLIDTGLFSNQSEITREAIRDLLLKYQSQMESKEPGVKRK